MVSARVTDHWRQLSRLSRAVDEEGFHAYADEFISLRNPWERGYMGRCRSKTGRKLVRVRAADTQETIWETVASGCTAESLPVLQEAILGAEHLLGLEGERKQAKAKRARTEIRLDSGS